MLDILQVLNGERPELKFTTEFCSCGEVLGTCPTCPKTIPYLDCLVSMFSTELDDGTVVYQLKTQTYSKPTDIHKYIHPASCTPNLSSKSPAIIKGVAHRLRLTNTKDEDLLAALGHYSGYLEASGYERKSILVHFSSILKTSNTDLVLSSKLADCSFKCPLVTKMHPALPDIRAVMKKYSHVISSCPLSSKISPDGSIFPAYRKLPSLSTILLQNPFSSPSSSKPFGFFPTPNCSCKLCKESFFCTMFSSPSIPGRSFSFDKHLTCKDVWVVYAIKCTLCDKLYVGQTDNPKARWSNHKSHVRCARETCNFATHCIRQHSDLMVGEGKLMQTSIIKENIQFTILDKALDCTEQTLCRLEERWRNKLKSWVPNGLNSRNDGPKEMRKKTIIK